MCGVHRDSVLLRQRRVIGPERYAKIQSKRKIWRIGRIRCQPFSIFQEALIRDGGDDPDIRGNLAQQRLYFSSRETADPPLKLWCSQNPLGLDQTPFGR